MQARIVLVNRQRGMYAAEMTGTEYVIFELMDSEAPELGDIVSHPDFYSMGSETFHNISQGYRFDVYVQNVCGASQVKQQCFL